jgi:hypothetical protein
MNASSNADRLVSDLDAALKDPLGLNLQCARDLGEFLADTPKARYLVKPRVRIAAHFDIEPAFLILDPLLGTLGVVELAVVEDGDQSDGIRKRVERHVDRATYARHLLLRDSELSVQQPALTVELVLLTEEEKDAVDEIGDALRGLLRDTDAPFQVGISVLRHAGGKAPFQGRLRRAFPWLLTAARQWLAAPGAQLTDHAANASGSRHLRRLSLHNYRLPGTREITLSDAGVHLIHGPNGSGKSSIVEALELVTSGQVERLHFPGAEENQYDHVIRNRHSERPAVVQLEWRAGNAETPGDEARADSAERHPVTPEGIERPLAAAVPASSFRLDQSLMDRLIGHSPDERAHIFLKSFFPDAAASLDAYEEATQSLNTALASVHPVRERLEAAKRVLGDLQSWQSSVQTTTSEDYSDVLNQWLERSALVDMAQRVRAVGATLRAAREAGWQPGDANGAAMISALSVVEPNVGDLERHESQGAEEVNELQEKLASFRPAPSPVAFTGGQVRSVTVPQVEALNAVSHWLFTADALQSFGPLGDKLNRVINAGDNALTYATVVIGGDRWAEPILTDLEAMISACNALETGTVPEWPGKAPFQEFDNGATAQKAQHAAAAQLTTEFISKLRADDAAAGEFNGSLIAAVNELMALFTPARWGYADVQLPPKLGEGKLGVRFEIEEHEDPARKSPVRAELHFNTAELNLFTVALFFLCAFRVSKPLGLMVCDDPLQNMDELTSTAVARGLAKLMRLWADLGRHEELLLLFHSSSDLERFSAELPAATYRLPWLSPSRTATEEPIKVEGTTVSGAARAVQSIKEMLQARD